MNHQKQISFKELKKELKDIEPLTKENLDVKSWSSDIQLWIDLQDITNPKKIYIACVITSKGEPRQIIQELKSKDTNEDSDTDSENSDSEDEQETEHYPSLAKIVEALETFYGIKENQNQLLREIRALRIRKAEKVKDFNKRYRSLYLKLNKKKKDQVSVLDYAESLQNNREAWKRVSLKDDISLEKAFSVAEKVDRLTTKVEGETDIANSYVRKPYYNTSSTTYHKRDFRENIKNNIRI
eukprot:jgi/Orpsp1_1/1186643/evm.model.d7180000052195.1